MSEEDKRKLKDKESIPATDGSQGGTSQPGPPTDPEDVNEGVDFSKPDTGEGGTENSKDKK